MNTRRSAWGAPTMPARRRFGAEVAETVDVAPPADSPYADKVRVTEVLEQALPVVRALTESSSSQTPEVLRAKIRNNLRMRDGLARGSALWTLYDNRVNVLRAKLKLAERRRSEDIETRQSRRAWSALGKVGLVVAVVAGAATVAVLLRVARAIPPARRSR